MDWMICGLGNLRARQLTDSFKITFRATVCQSDHSPDTAKFPDSSLIIGFKFPAISRFSRQVVTLFGNTHCGINSMKLVTITAIPYFLPFYTQKWFGAWEEVCDRYLKRRYTK